MTPSVYGFFSSRPKPVARCGAAARPRGRSPRPAAVRCAPARSACPWRAAPGSPSRSGRPVPARGSRAVRPHVRARRSAHPAPHPKRSCSDLTKPAADCEPSTPHSLRGVFLVALNRTRELCRHSNCSEALRLVGVVQSSAAESRLTHTGRACLCRSEARTRPGSGSRKSQGVRPLPYRVIPAKFPGFTRSGRVAHAERSGTRPGSGRAPDALSRSGPAASGRAPASAHGRGAGA